MSNSEFSLTRHPFKKKLDPRRAEREQFFKESLEQGKTHREIEAEGLARKLFYPFEFHQKLHYYEDKFGMKAVYFISEKRREASRRARGKKREPYWRG
jgi:hypothetical protein